MRNAFWKQKIRAWTVRTSLPVYLFLYCALSFAAYFVGFVLLNYCLEQQLRSPRGIGAHYWLTGTYVSLAAAFGFIPLFLAKWYEARREPTEETIPRTNGLFLLYSFALMWCLLIPGLNLITDSNKRAQVFPIHWVTTSGQLLSFKSGTGTEDFFSPDVRYSYTVDGRHYESSQVSFEGDGNGNVPFATALPWKKRVAHPIPVYYDAANPQLAALVLRQGPNYDLIVRLSLFALGWCMGLAAVFHEDSVERTKEPAA